MAKRTSNVREYLASIGAKGGQKGGLAKGKAKVRGDSEYYRTISSLASKARAKKRKAKK